MPEDPSQLFLTVKEIARQLRLNPLTIYEYIRSGKLVAMRFGRYYRVLRQDFQNFIDQQRVRL